MRKSKKKQKKQKKQIGGFRSPKELTCKSLDPNIVGDETCETHKFHDDDDTLLTDDKCNSLKYKENGKTYFCRKSLLGNKCSKTRLFQRGICGSQNYETPISKDNNDKISQEASKIQTYEMEKKNREIDELRHQLTELDDVHHQNEEKQFYKEHEKIEWEEKKKELEKRHYNELKRAVGDAHRQRAGLLHHAKEFLPLLGELEKPLLPGAGAEDARLRAALAHLRRVEPSEAERAKQRAAADRLGRVLNGGTAKIYKKKRTKKSKNSKKHRKKRTKKSRKHRKTRK